jgi:hypothetical protein
VSEELNIGEPMSQMDENAVSLHELYCSYVRAGFSESQSFELTQVWLSHAIDNQE